MTRLRFLLRCTVAGSLLLGTSACSDDPGGTGVDTSGPVTVTLATPSADDGALLVVITGPAISDLRASSNSYQVFWRAAGANETRVIVVGDILAGPLFTAKTPAGSAPSDLTATVTEVSNRADALRPSVAGYSLSITR